METRLISKFFTVIFISLLLNGCGSGARASLEYDSTTRAYAAGANTGDTLLALNPDKPYSKAWVEKQWGKITYEENKISFNSQEAFNICSQTSQVSYPKYIEEQNEEYMDYLAGCMNALGWSRDDHGLTDIGL